MTFGLASPILSPPTQWRRDFYLDALRTEYRLLVDRGLQPLYVRFARSLSASTGNGSGDRQLSVLDDGRVVYTRWEYNDRGHIYVQPLFQMNSDGTGRTEYYGNNSIFPASLLHAEHSRNRSLFRLRRGTTRINMVTCGCRSDEGTSATRDNPALQVVRNRRAS